MPAEFNKVVFFRNRMLSMLTVHGLRIMLDKQHPMGFDVEFPGNTGSDMATAASYRHRASDNIRDNNDYWP
jgi:hypothetical protein